MRYDTCYTLHHHIIVPDVQIKKDKSEYVYVPLRGSSVTLAVLNIHDVCIGWTTSTTLGYDSVKEWMIATKWVDQGY